MTLMILIFSPHIYFTGSKMTMYPGKKRCNPKKDDKMLKGK